MQGVFDHVLRTQKQLQAVEDPNCQTKCELPVQKLLLRDLLRIVTDPVERKYTQMMGFYL